MKKYLLWVSMLAPVLAWSQNLAKPNEKVLYAFSFNSEREVNILLDSSGKYMMFRMGLPKKLEMEFPAKLQNSFDNFTFTFNFKPNGPKNDGYSQNYLWFVLGNKKYVVYEELYSLSKIPDVGLLIIDLTTNISYETKGLPETRQGSLEDLRDESLVKEAPGLFR